MIVRRCEVDDVVLFQQIVVWKRVNDLTALDRIEINLSICVDNEMVFTLVDLCVWAGEVRLDRELVGISTTLNTHFSQCAHSCVTYIEP